MHLFRTFILRRLLREPLRTLSTTIGIALGVAVIVAIQLTNASSLAGFETALNTVSGRASLEIIGPGVGVDERLLPALDSLSSGTKSGYPGCYRRRALELNDVPSGNLLRG